MEPALDHLDFSSYEPAPPVHDLIDGLLATIMA